MRKKSIDRPLSDLGENELVRMIAGWTRAARAPELPQGRPSWADWSLPAGIGDDAAIARLNAGAPQALTTDMLVEGTHFLPGSDPLLLGRKSVEVNLSDLAAMGAWPVWILVSLGLPRGVRMGWVKSFYQGIRAALKPYGALCLGGDCVLSETIVVNIAAGGACDPEGLPPLRSAARPGQYLYVTGTLGDSGAGLSLLRDTGIAQGSRWRGALVRRHLAPAARVREGIEIARLRCGAMMDLSDGLGTDLPRMADASGCGFEVSLNALPISSALRRLAPVLPLRPEEFAMFGGEDYELLFTTGAPESRWLEKVAHAGGGRPVRVTRIGRVVEGAGVRYLDARGREVIPRDASFQHY